MKAHIRSTVPKRALTYQIQPELQERLSAVLRQLSIEEYPVSAEELTQPVGYLAGFPGFVKNEDGAPQAPPSCGSVLCLCGISNAELNALLKGMKEQEIEIPLKATVTAANQHWRFEQLITELSKEHEALRQRRSRS